MELIQQLSFLQAYCTGPESLSTLVHHSPKQLRLIWNFAFLVQLSHFCKHSAAHKRSFGTMITHNSRKCVWYWVLYGEFLELNFHRQQWKAAWIFAFCKSPTTVSLYIPVNSARAKHSQKSDQSTTLKGHIFNLENYIKKHLRVYPSSSLLCTLLIRVCHLRAPTIDLSQKNVPFLTIVSWNWKMTISL